MLDSIKSVLSTVQKYAPSIALGLTNPVAGIAQAAYMALSSAVGETDAVKIVEKFNVGLSPADELAIKKSDYEFYSNYNNAIVSALQQVAEIQKITHEDQSPTTTKLRVEAFRVTSILLLIYELGLIYLAYTKALDSVESAVLGNIGGVIIAKYATIIDFLFGTGIDSVMGYFKSN